MIGRDDYIDGVDAGDRIVNAVNNVNKVPTPRQAVQLGLTATPKRKDNADTCACFGGRLLSHLEDRGFEEETAGVLLLPM